MRKSFLLVAVIVFSLLSLQAAKPEKKEKKEEVYKFVTVKELPTTSVKDQHRSGTCWSFATTSFLESELLRAEKGEFDLSDMYSVLKSYQLKGDKYVRLHGKAYFPTGGASNDAMDVFERFGMVPESAFEGLEYGSEKHDHSELDRVLSGFLKAVVDSKKISPAWKVAYNAILESYLGEDPETFTYEGKEYTPKTFASEAMGLDPNDYVKLTSYTHYPFYTAYEMDVPDNWNRGIVYNVTLDELQEVADNSIDKGYTVVWGGDVSDKGFSWKNGVAIIPDVETGDIKGTDRDKWETISASSEKKKSAYSFETIVPEKEITQEYRQKAYDSWEATDDHGMHLVGIAKDQEGNLYYKIKNSWDVSNSNEGYVYMSVPFYRYNTLDIMVHKDAIPADIKTKLNL